MKAIDDAGNTDDRSSVTVQWLRGGDTDLPEDVLVRLRDPDDHREFEVTLPIRNSKTYEEVQKTTSAKDH